jgi:hypothetical protein
MKKIIVALVFVISGQAIAGLSDGEAAILGIFIGSQIQRNSQNQEYRQPQRVYQYRNSNPDVYRDPCFNSYSSVEAAYCRGAMARQQEIIRNAESDAYNRGYRGN